MIVERAVWGTADVVLLRLIPFSAYALCGRSLARQTRTYLVGTFALVLLIRLGYSPREPGEVLRLFVGWVYYAALAPVVYHVARLHRKQRLTRGAVFTSTYSLYLLLPGLAFPDLAIDSFLAVGWASCFGAFSYCVDSTAQTTLRQCAFFMLVDPVLVFSDRSKRAVGGRAQAVGRMLMGVLLMILGSIGVKILYLKVHEAGQALGLSMILLIGLLRFLSEYAAHSGLASIQISVMRLSGWLSPERYTWPLLARSPRDFWNRWNIYLRRWLEKYVFLPSGVWLARRWRSRRLQLGAIAFTLLCSGLMHDAYVLAGRQRFVTSGTSLFLSAALVLVAWELAATGSNQFVQRRTTPSVAQLSRTLSHVTMLVALSLAGITWG